MRPCGVQRGSHLVPGVTIGVGLADFAVEAVGVGGHHHLRHQRRKSLPVVCL